MWKITAMIAAAVVFSLSSVAGETPPRYDVEAYCTQIATSEAMLDFCYDDEQAAYNALKPEWPTFPERIRAYCDQIASSYAMLQFCIDQEMEAAANNRGRAFQY